MTTEYKTIPNTDNRYLATKDGHVFDTKNNKYVAEIKTQRGWYQCHIWYNKQRITIHVHRLIAFAWLGISDLTVNHKDGNKSNNSIDNLEYMTLQEQNKHRSEVLKRGNRKPIRCIEQDRIYDSIRSFCLINGFKPANCHISAICKQKYGACLI